MEGGKPKGKPSGKPMSRRFSAIGTVPWVSFDPNTACVSVFCAPNDMGIRTDLPGNSIYWCQRSGQDSLRYTLFMTRLIFAPMVLALSSLPATAQVKIHVSPSHHKTFETIHTSVENAGSKPITFCIQVGQTSPKRGGEIEATPSPFWVQKNSDGRWSTLLIGPDVGSFQHPEILEPGRSLDFPFRLGESGQMRLSLTYWNGSQQSLACDAPPKSAKVATSEPFAVE
jgi:hypothetical protein